MLDSAIVDIGFVLGRLIVTFFFGIMGLNHFMQLEAMTQYAASKGVPAPKISVIVSGFLLLVAALIFLTGAYPELGVLALIIFFVPTNLLMHNFWAISDEQQKMMEMTQFLKNLSMLGFSLILLAVPTPWKFGLGFSF